MTTSELLGVALKIEGAGYSYYTKLSNISSGKLKELFLELANEEREHAKIFEDILKEHEDENLNLNEEEIGYLRAFADNIIFPKLNIDKIPQSIKEALKLAIEVEKDSIIFYNDIKMLILNNDALEKIIEEEKKHMKKLTLKLNENDTFDMYSEGSKI
ncbi:MULTISPECIES: ferritin family protein [unclassified Thermosipho (in: thermotogales)]|uniref:ferritin-like domain-containing protein n=1 Tax=unclassified Thermosipho (in: thermotogales) TaxID=2676525 RepID=UPI00098444ED|nr:MULTISPECIES: ferritin family protein [unclassified Thermosipho (in: thermotogales)]MBT1247902.1 ferritin [Thermosipho sp. 1244]OOC44663.1 ferritin [Thermosipho sp. 1074]OOC47052.1 ferritin [Thermosipho sp. 1223]